VTAILGLNAYHGDAAAALVVDGELVAAAEEERFNRIKHVAGFPSLAAAWCLSEGGIRPEDLYETSPRPGDERLVPIAMRVLAVEPLGAETLLVLALDGSAEEIIARIGRETRLRPDDRATLLLDAAAIQLFDAATTRVIARDRA